MAAAAVSAHRSSALLLLLALSQLASLLPRGHALRLLAPGTARSTSRRSQTRMAAEAPQVASAAAAEEAGATPPRRVWDHENGVWIGSLEEDHIELPQPLWIFGYGSLCWRPEDSWVGYEKRQGYITGRRRMFAQRSMDHRGTPVYPGLVVTLVDDAHLEAAGLRDPAAPPSRSFGAIYRIPDSEAPAVLADLDHREKGGYTRCVVDVHCAATNFNSNFNSNFNIADTSSPTPSSSAGSGAEEVIQALLYTGTVDNPNFWLVGEEEAARVIARAHGPSGPNTEYLFNLATWLRFSGAEDEHVEQLEARVLKLLAAAANEAVEAEQQQPQPDAAQQQQPDAAEQLTAASDAAGTAAASAAQSVTAPTL